jgi:cytoskeletal protein CcmA (bactofilin family)
MWETKKKTVTESNAEHFTVLGKDVTFKGIVHFQGTVQLDSCFEGAIHTNGVLVVGEHAVIRGTLSVGTLISSGKIHGTVVATDKVQLLKTAVQIGDVQAPIFSIEEGAYFKGLTEMGPSQSADELLQTAASLTGEPLWHAAASLPLADSESGTKQIAYDRVQEEVIRQTLPR